MAAPAVTKSVLALEGVDFGYGQPLVLRGLTLRVAAGEMVGLLGPNGSGKTTILRLLTGALAPRQGAVLVDGRPRQTHSRRDLGRQLALAPQEIEIAFDFRVRDLVLMGRGPYVHWLRGETAHDRAVASQAMAHVGILDLAERLYRTLSGGEKQRVVLAMALAQEPRVLLLDEPTSNLDLAHQALLLDLVRQLNRERGLTVLSIMHEVNMASMYCDRLVLLRDGGILADGPPEAVITEDLILRGYGAAVRVIPHPESGRPQVMLRPGARAPWPLPSR